MANIEKLQIILDLIKAQPEMLYMHWWDQALYFKLRNITTDYYPDCNTPKCFAGHTVWKFKQDEYPTNKTPLREVGRIISDKAQEILELTDDEADSIFDSSDSLVIDIVESIINNYKQLSKINE